MHSNTKFSTQLPIKTFDQTPVLFLTLYLIDICLVEVGYGEGSNQVG